MGPSLGSFRLVMLVAQVLAAAASLVLAVRLRDWSAVPEPFGIAPELLPFAWMISVSALILFAAGAGVTWRARQRWLLLTVTAWALVAAATFAVLLFLAGYDPS